MLFNSYPFVFGFLPAVLLGFAILSALGARKAAPIYLLAASLLFYGWWDWKYPALVGFSIAFNFSWAQLLLRPPPQRAGSGRRGLLAIGVAVNLFLLGYCKYRNFFVATVDGLFGLHWQPAPVVLTLAVSFFSFEQIIYLVAAHNGETEPGDFFGYSLYVTFFPHLIAGPIVRYKQIVPQLKRAATYRFSPASLASGLMIFAIGLFKKAIIADTFRPWVERVYDGRLPPSLGDAWGATLAFALQIYFDFSGYTDMAIGLAQMFNIRFPENFDSPYQARSVIDFWRRWHTTLSSFLRDYLYIPLGGNQRGLARQHLNIFITMLLGGLWHGANWTFVTWGALHGVYLSINHLWRRLNVRLPGAVSWMITLLAVVVAWVFFRAQGFERARAILVGMAGLNGLAGEGTSHFIRRHEMRRLALAAALVLWAPNRQVIMQWRWKSEWLYAGVFALLAGISMLTLANPPSFIYFQF